MSCIITTAVRRLITSPEIQTNWLTYFGWDMPSREGLLLLSKAGVRRYLERYVSSEVVDTPVKRGGNRQNIALDKGIGG